MDFYEEMRKNSTIRTENGALGWATSGKDLLDLNFAAASLRSATEAEILERFKAAYSENPILATRWAFFARDIKGGLGERRLFRVILNYIAQHYIVPPRDLARAKNLFNLIEKYGRYDDFINLIDNEAINAEVIVEVISEKLGNDILAMTTKKNSVSLLAKWMPSINTSSAATKARARKIAKIMGISHALYRKTLKSLRDYINVVEAQISRNKWGEVNYEAVPSYANLKYANAFMKHDQERRTEYLDSLTKGEAKINSSTLFTYDIVNKYFGSSYDETYEQLWKNLPNREISNTLVVADTSGSMCTRIGNTSISAYDVATSLAIYFSEHNTGVFRNKCISFSESPRFIRFDENDSLYNKIETMWDNREVANTDIVKVFDLILKTAIRNKCSQEELPERVLIISDMEFDYMADCDEVLFERIKEEFAAAGYKIPRLIFWNVNSRTGAIPVTENDLGVALVSGFSTTIAEMVMSDETDPYKILLDKLEDYKDTDILVENSNF